MSYSPEGAHASLPVFISHCDILSHHCRWMCKGTQEVMLVMEWIIKLLSRGVFSNTSPAGAHFTTLTVFNKNHLCVVLHSDFTWGKYCKLPDHWTFTLIKITKIFIRGSAAASGCNSSDSAIPRRNRQEKIQTSWFRGIPVRNGRWLRVLRPPPGGVRTSARHLAAHRVRKSWCRREELASAPRPQPVMERLGRPGGPGSAAGSAENPDEEPQVCSAWWI